MERTQVKQKKILIYDDISERTENFKDKLEKGLNKANQNDNFEIKLFNEIGLQDSIKSLQQRRIKFREKTEIHLEDGGEEIDSASILIIDYDLLGSQVEDSPTGSLTGEIISYLVRCFSQCKLIVGLNQYGHNPFDLTLSRDLESFADINLGEDQLGNSDLWQGDWGSFRRGCRPWSWPNLTEALSNFDKRVKDVQDNLDKPICEVLHFDTRSFQFLSRAIVQFIGKYEEKEPFKTTFREFITKSGNGLKPKDTRNLNHNINDHVLARVGAARISKWLERLVLPEQDILVDAPHLISRYPSLITDYVNEIGVWNKTARLIDYNKLGINTSLIESCRFQKNHWISRPVWFWDRLRECREIKEVTEPWLTVKSNWVFCEDASRFYQRADCKEFFADTISPFTRRFVKGFKGVEYRPIVRFAL